MVIKQISCNCSYFFYFNISLFLSYPLLRNVCVCPDEQRSLIASLNLSLERLDADLLELLPRLGVFQGRALESQILEITEFSTEHWELLKSALKQTGLVQVDVLEDVETPLLRFHPTLSPMLWEQLSAFEQANLTRQHQQHYYVLARYLYEEDSQDPDWARSIARQELPNLLWAVKEALADQSDNAVIFVTCVNKFLNNFGLQRDLNGLTDHLSQITHTVGSNNWYLLLSNQGDELFKSGKYASAATIFTKILQGFTSEPSINRINALVCLGRCFSFLGKLSDTAQCLREAFDLSGKLDQSDKVKEQRGAIQTDLGDVLAGLGKFNQAQKAYDDALEIDLDSGNQRGVAIIKAQLGNLAMAQGDLNIATKRHNEALKIFQKLQDPEQEAVAWHQLGMVYQENQQWAEADSAYRKSAGIRTKRGNTSGVAKTYGQIGTLRLTMNEPIEAEEWYRKAQEIYRTSKDKLGESRQLNNLAYLIASQPNRLLEAQQLASEALAIKQTLDPAVASIWTTYNVMEKIATAQGETDTARKYRQLARTAKVAFAGTQYELQQHESFIVTVVAAVGDKAVQAKLEPILTQKIENGWGQLVAAIRRVLAGEREVEVLWDDLDLDDSMIIAAILGRVSEL
jgi:tetratricopeptide (TPR) repeat protein